MKIYLVLLSVFLVTISNQAFADTEFSIRSKGSDPKQLLTIDVKEEHNEIIVSKQNVVYDIKIESKDEKKQKNSRIELVTLHTDERTIKNIKKEGIEVLKKNLSTQILNSVGIAQEELELEIENNSHCPGLTYTILKDFNVINHIQKNNSNNDFFNSIVQQLVDNENYSRIPEEPLGVGAEWKYDYKKKVIPLDHDTSIEGGCRIVEQTKELTELVCVERSSTTIDNIVVNHEKFGDDIPTKIDVKTDWLSNIIFKKGKLPYLKFSQYTIITKTDFINKNKPYNQPTKEFIKYKYTKKPIN